MQLNRSLCPAVGSIEASFGVHKVGDLFLRALVFSWLFALGKSRLSAEPKNKVYQEEANIIA